MTYSEFVNNPDIINIIDNVFYVVLSILGVLIFTIYILPIIIRIVDRLIYKK